LNPVLGGPVDSNPTDSGPVDSDATGAETDSSGLAQASTRRESGQPGASETKVTAVTRGRWWRRGWGRALRWTLQLVLTVLVTWIIISQVGVTLDEALTLDRALPAVQWWMVATSALLLLACFGITARLWGRMVAELGAPDPGWIGANRIVLSANLGRYLPGKVWQVAGLAVLSRREGIPVSLGVSAGVLGQAFHLVGAAVVGAAALGALDGMALGVWVGFGALAVFVVATALPSLLRGAFRLIFRVARLDPASAPAPDPLFGPRWVVLHTLVWCGYGVAFAVLVRGLGLDGGTFALAASFSAAYLLGYLAIFAPAGIGVREGVLIALLRPSLGAAAVGVAVLARVWMTLVELLPAGLFALWAIFKRTPVDSDSGGMTDG